MKYAKQFRIVAIAALMLLWIGRDVMAQIYMNDGSVTYVDSWASTAGIYGYGSTTGSLYYHQYAVDVTIRSPTGRTATGNGVLQFGNVSTTALMPWNTSDRGNYSISSTHRGFCTRTAINFIISPCSAESVG